MWFVLALRLGATVRELKSRMTHREFVWWRALFRFSPFDDERCFDLPAAHVAVQMNRFRGGEAELHDFMPYRYRRKPSASDLPENEMGLMDYLHSRKTVH